MFVILTSQDSDNMVIFPHQLIQFFSNNATNLHPSTTHSTTVLPHKMAIALRPQICDVTSPYVLWPNGWMDKDATWYGDRPRPRPHCVRWGPTSPTERGTTTPPPLYSGNCWALLQYASVNHRRRSFSCRRGTRVERSAAASNTHIFSVYISQTSEDSSLPALFPWLLVSCLSSPS